MLLLLKSTGSRVHRAQQLWHTGIVSLQHVESSLTRDRTHVSCIGRQTLNHWTTREVLKDTLLFVLWIFQLWLLGRIHMLTCLSHNQFLTPSPGGSAVKNLPARQETQVLSLGQEDSLEKEMSTHSNILAWRIPQTEEPRGLQSLWSQRVRHNLATKQQQVTRNLFPFPLFLALVCPMGVSWWLS